MADLSAAVDNLKDGVTDASKRVAAVLPLWVIIVIVVVGTGLLALLVGLCCLCACRRRRGRKVAGDAANGFSDIHRHPATALPSDGGSRSSEEGPGGRHKLRKRPPSSSSSSSFGNDNDGVVVDDRGVVVEEVEEGRGRGEPEFRNMASVPARKASLLAIPPMLTGALRASIVSIGGGRRSAGRGGSGGLNINNDEAADQGRNWHGRRTSEAWIDDDALHGPEVSPTKRSSAARRKSRMKSWRASIRESWPLKTPSPTLPHLPHFGGNDGRQAGAAAHESVALFQYNKNYGGTDGDRLVPNLPSPLSAAARQRDGQPSPPRQLPKPPSQALLAASASTAGLRPVSNLYGAGPAVSNSPRSRGLSYYKYEDTDQPVKSSGSPRSKTERGVGVGTGVVGPRGRRPSADSTMSQILKDTEKRLQDGMVTGVATRNRSGSSPSKRTPGLGLGPDAVTVAMVRSRSRTPSPTKPSRMPHGAASSHVRQGSQASFASEPDSLVGDDTPSLPYHGLTSPSRSKPSQQLSPHRRRPSLVPSFASSASSLSTIPSETEEGPLTPNTTAPNSSIPFGMNQIAGLGDPFMPSKASTPASKKAQGSASRGAHDSGDRPHKRDKTSNTRSDSPLSPATGNMRSPDTTPTRGGARNTAAQGANKTPNPVSQPSRALVLTVPASAQGDDRSGSSHKRKPSDDPAATTTPRLSLVIPGNENKPNPLFKRLSDLAPPSRSRDQTPEVAHAHPSPALSNARLSSAGRRRGEDVSSSAASVSSSLYSDTGAAERERERQNAALSRISMLLNRDVTAPSRPKPTVRVVPRDYYPHGSNNINNNDDARVSATVAELRRMNSQVSTYSTAAASTYSDGSSAATLAAVRPESVVPPRRAAAARNYHALASPIKSSPDREVRGRDEVGGLTPTRNRRLGRSGSDEMGGSGSGSGSGSEDGVSLYDQDGFYITPGRRAGVRF
ncbi:hypothetical protein INS49_015506 [Diaporthe citri]|uniref:uncharacterized protein n=1 Tax=Diaporthe citri TaxID=83186 RepID=UPI001C7E9A07|nr:uncharacterized protein INS49_015506 [Diaporthe citri]KAG6356120.1 hypothetical protein INS49_015506 [Diaporthe citri]